MAVRKDSQRRRGSGYAPPRLQSARRRPSCHVKRYPGRAPFLFVFLFLFLLTLPRTLSHMHTLLCSPQQPLANSCFEQDHWHHRIPKAKGRAPRININFRSLTLVHTCAETHAYTHAYTLKYSLSNSLTHSNTRTHTHAHTCMHACIHAYILTYVHPYMYVCMYVFVCVCVYVCSFPSVPVCALNDTAQRP